MEGSNIDARVHLCGIAYGIESGVKGWLWLEAARIVGYNRSFLLEFQCHSLPGRISQIVGERSMIKNMLCFLLTIVMLASFGTNVWSQGKGKDAPSDSGNNAKSGAQIVKLQGKVDDWKGTMLQVVAENDEKKIIALPKELTKIRYNAPATLAWLSKGMFVRFSVELDEQGRPTRKLDAIQVFMPLPQQQMRRMPEEQLRRYIPGVYPAGAAAGTDLVNQRPAQNGFIRQNYDVVGQIIGMQADQLGVQCGNLGLAVGVEDKAEVNVTAYGLDLVKKGDSVSVSGLSSPKTPDQITADSIDISPEKPLGTGDEAIEGKEVNSKKKSGVKRKGG